MSEVTQTQAEQEHHSRAEFESAMLKLSPAERLRLKRVGLKYSGGSGMAPDDLIAEAYIRAASSTRNWRVGISVVRFMAEAMRSIASGERESVKAERQAQPRLSRRPPETEAEFITDRKGVVLEFNRPHPSPEQDIIDREEAASEASRLEGWRDELLAEFDDDDPAQFIVAGLLDGMRGKALQELCGLTGSEFSTKYKKVSRRIDVLTKKRVKS